MKIFFKKWLYKPIKNTERGVKNEAEGPRWFRQTNKMLIPHLCPIIHDQKLAPIVDIPGPLVHEIRQFHVTSTYFRIG